LADRKFIAHRIMLTEIDDVLGLNQFDMVGTWK
jgi:hypothetical protein